VDNETPVLNKDKDDAFYTSHLKLVSSYNPEIILHSDFKYDLITEISMANIEQCTHHK
jgi:hypothetical protein